MLFHYRLVIYQTYYALVHGKHYRSVLNFPIHFTPCSRRSNRGGGSSSKIDFGPSPLPDPAAAGYLRVQDWPSFESLTSQPFAASSSRRRSDSAQFLEPAAFLQDPLRLARHGALVEYRLDVSGNLNGLLLVFEEDDAEDLVHALKNRQHASTALAVRIAHQLEERGKRLRNVEIVVDGRGKIVQMLLRPVRRLTISCLLDARVDARQRLAGVL